MKAFITKYALTTGIQEVDDAEVSKHAPSMISVDSLGWLARFHGEGRDWHRTKDAAIERAETMRLKRLSSMNKQIKKLQALKFQ